MYSRQMRDRESIWGISDLPKSTVKSSMWTVCAIVTLGYQLQAHASYSAPTRAASAKMMGGSPLAASLDKSKSVLVQGNTLKTWDVGEETVERVQLQITSGGRPVHSRVELWYTPAYVPSKISVYTEDGKYRPVDIIIETPKSPKTVAVYNTGSLDFPFTATVAHTGMDKAYYSLKDITPEHVQGGRITSYTFGPEVEAVQILLTSKVNNLKAKIELTQGPNQVKQIVEIYSSTYKNPLYLVMQTPGANNAIRVINEHTVEFPFDAWVLPYKTAGTDASAPVMGGF